MGDKSPIHAEFRHFGRHGESFVEAAEWHGRQILSVSIFSHDTREEHVDRLADAMIAARRVVTVGQVSCACLTADRRAGLVLPRLPLC